MTWRPEWVALGVNVVMFACYVLQRPFEPGKALYWGGVVVLTVGLLKMRG